jgi:sugar phosphate isomerase/epimerase
MTTLGMCTATLLTDPMGASEKDVRVAAEAAVGAGCHELSVWVQHLQALGDPASFGAQVAVVEAATVWATGDAAAASEEARTLAELAAGCGAATIAAVTMDPTLSDPARAQGNLAALVDIAAEVPAQVCVEFLPWSAIPSLAVAWELVEESGAGILLDTWHWHRQPGGPNSELLASIPGERIGYVQVCDAAATPMDDSLTEAMSARVLPGDGVVDFAEVFALLGGIGAGPFVATEIFNPGFVAERGPHAAAVAMAAAGQSVVP